MVTFLEKHFKDHANFVDLNSVSDGICNNNSKEYINFDEFIHSLYQKGYFSGDTFSSPDTILLNSTETHLILVEFKDMNSLQSEDNIKEWWKDKNRSVYLKITDTILGLGYYLKNNCDQNYDDFLNISKSFFYVYKSNTYKKKIKHHLQYKFSRYDFLFKNIRTAEATSFENFLTNNNL